MKQSGCNKSNIKLTLFLIACCMCLPDGISTNLETSTTKSAKEFQQKPKDKNIFYAHDKPKRCAYENVISNHTFILNKQAGVFTHLGHTKDIHQCKQMCCQVK